MTENEIKEFVSELRRKAEIFRKSGFATAGVATVFDSSADVIEELLPYRAIGTIEEFKDLKEKNEEVEIPEPKGNEIVAGIMLPNVKGKAVVSLSYLHDILMDITGIETRDKVFEQIYDRGVIIGLRDVIEKWEEKRKEMKAGGKDEN